MKALVTGANGLIGANLLRELLREGLTPTGLVRPTADLSSIGALPMELRTGDVLAPESLAPAMAGQDVVFHTAVAFSYWGHEPAEMARTAIEGSLNILTAAAQAKVKRVVMTSSSVTLSSDSPFWPSRARTDLPEMSSSQTRGEPTLASSAMAGATRAATRSGSRRAICLGTSSPMISER